MNAKIIAIGDEILQGQTLDTNSNFLSQKLTDLSFTVEEIQVIGDIPIQIKRALGESIGKFNLILITGGLGPTSDDRTKQTLTEFFGGELVENKEVLEDVVKFLKARNFELNENNRRQALVPTSAEIIHNPNGTAPGMLFKKNNTILISMPGVPFEMQQLFTEKLIPVLKKHFQFPTKCLKIVHTFGIAEAMLAQRLKDFEKEIPPKIKMAYLPSPEGIKIKLWSFTGFQKRMCEITDDLVKKLYTLIGDNIFGEDEDTLELVLAKILRNSGKKISTAESCTGGFIAHKITSVSGSSEYFEGSVVSYSNDAKINLLNVSPQTIEQYGAVSQQTVIEMVKGALDKFNSDYAVAVSGIAGPSGGTDEKPVGTTWIAVGSKDKIIAKKYVFGQRRDINIRRSAATALFNLIKFIENKDF